MEKTAIFPNGLVHGFGQKLVIFPSLCFRQYKPGKYVLRYSRTKKRVSKLQKQEVLNVEKLTFFHLFVLGNICQENVFYDILERKKGVSKLQKQEVEKGEKFAFFQRG